MRKIYKSGLSGKKWMTLALLSDAGWIAYMTGFVLYMTNGAVGLETVVLSATFLLNCLAALAVMIGVLAIIFQRIRKLSRRIQKRSLIFGYGFAVFGSLTGCLVSGSAVIIDMVWHYETGICFASQMIMSVGSLVCFAFGLPVMKSFRPVEESQLQKTK